MERSRKESAAPLTVIAPDAITPGRNTAGTIGADAVAAHANTSACDSTQTGCATAPAEGEQRQVVKGEDRRKSVIDRRNSVERRQQTRAEAGYTGPERRSGSERREDTGLERRRGPGRRRSDDRKAAEEGEMTSEQFEFCMAIETYKKVNKKMFPTWTEVLEVVRHLGYRKVEQRDINLDNCPEPQLDQKTGSTKNAPA